MTHSCHLLLPSSELGRCSKGKKVECDKCLIFKTSDMMQLDQIYSKFVNTVLGECFDAIQNIPTKDAHKFLDIDVVPKKPQMQFRKKKINDFLVVQGNEIRNLKTN